MEYCSVFNKKEILTPATAQMNLEDITQINQGQKDQYSVIPFLWGV